MEAIRPLQYGTMSPFINCGSKEAGPRCFRHPVTRIDSCKTDANMYTFYLCKYIHEKQEYLMRVSEFGGNQIEKNKFFNLCCEDNTLPNCCKL